MCVCVTQLSYKKNCKFKMSFFYGLKQAVSQRRESVSESLYMNVYEAHSWCCCCGETWSKRKRVLEDDVFIENTVL